MKLINKSLRITKLPISCFLLEMSGGLRKETKRLLKADILRALKKKKIDEVRVLEVSLNLGVWANQKVKNDTRNKI